MKKILLGLFILSSLSFANQTWPNKNTATVPITVKATIENPNIQLTIFDSKENIAINEVFIDHGTLDANTFVSSEATGTFRVSRSADGKTNFISGDILTFDISKPTVDLKLRGTGEVFLHANLVGAFSQQSGSPITAIQSIKSTLKKRIDIQSLIPGEYISNEASLTVTLNKASI